MKIDEVRNICVVGAGTMGSQIAQQCALYGFPVWLTDTDGQQLEKALQSNRALLQRRVDKGRMTADEMQSALDLVQVTTEMGIAAEGADFVIEAAVERLEVKRDVFAALSRICRSDAVLATNSSAIGISRIVTELTDPGRAINMHFFHPVLVMQLVEVMHGPATSQETVDATAGLARLIGKEPVVISKEVEGLLVNRILGAIKREAFWLAEEGYATPQDIPWGRSSWPTSAVLTCSITLPCSASRKAEIHNTSRPSSWRRRYRRDIWVGRRAKAFTTTQSKGREGRHSVQKGMLCDPAGQRGP